MSSPHNGHTDLQAAKRGNHTPMRIALYTRVSKNLSPQDCENQSRQLRDYCTRQSWTITREYTERKSAKAGSKRDSYAEMMLAASRREFDILLVWALDRFNRAGVAQTFRDIDILRGYGVSFESFTEPQFRNTGQTGDLMIALAAWIAQQERQRIVERVKAGLERAKAQGRVGGRPRIICDRQAVHDLHLAGHSLRAIAAQTSLAVTTIRRILLTRTQVA